VIRWLTLLCSLLAAPVWAATYYVDPATGSNANAGTSSGAPWLNPPGTRLADDSGWWSAAWGAIDGTPKIACGDTIYLKGGSTQTSAQGGNWHFESTFYTTGCTTGSRVTLKVATSGEWSGASGDFTLNANGVTASNFQSDWPSIIFVDGLDYFQLLGVSGGHLLIENYTAQRGGSNVSGLLAYHGAGVQTGFRGDYLDFATGGYGVTLGKLDQCQVSNVIVTGMTMGGITSGLLVDAPMTACAVVNATVHDSGPTTDSGTRQVDGFNFTGHKDLWCIHCTVYNDGERGASARRLTALRERE